MVRSNSESEPATTDRRGNDADLYVRVRASSAPRKTRTRLRDVADIACRSVTSSARSRSRSRPSAEREAGFGRLP